MFAKGEEIICVQSHTTCYFGSPFPLKVGQTYICNGVCPVSLLHVPRWTPYIEVVGYGDYQFSHILFRPVRRDTDEEFLKSVEPSNMRTPLPQAKVLTLEEYSRILKERYGL